MDTNCAKRIELDVFKTFKYCNISGTVIRRNARRNRRPGGVVGIVVCVCSCCCCSFQIQICDKNFVVVEKLLLMLLLWFFFKL